MSGVPGSADCCLSSPDARHGPGVGRDAQSGERWNRHQAAVPRGLCDVVAVAAIRPGLAQDAAQSAPPLLESFRGGSSALTVATFGFHLPRVYTPEDAVDAGSTRLGLTPRRCAWSMRATCSLLGRPGPLITRLSELT